MPGPASVLHPTAELATRVLLPGDPGRALQLATELLDRPLMFNHTRGLWGYTGTAADGEPLTIQATGMGGPSAALITRDLCELGMQTAIRIGTAWAGPAGPPLGSLVAIPAALALDGTSRALGAAERIDADAELATALAEWGPAIEVSSGDVAPDPATLAPGSVHDLSTAAVLAATADKGVRAAAVLAIAHTPSGHLDTEGLREAASALGRAAADALGIPARLEAPLPPPREDAVA